MKQVFSPTLLPSNAIFLTCSSHESRCRGGIGQLGEWRPNAAIIFHYDDSNPRREENHRAMELMLERGSVEVSSLPVTEASAAMSLHANMESLRSVLNAHSEAAIVFDISVLTKRHLLMLLRWLDDAGYWDRLTAVYSEPEDYDVSKYIPLSFGLSTLHQIPGFAACPDLSRPLHLVLFLGYEGDRALAVYEHIQPMQTTLAVPYPPFKPSWIGRTEKFNADLLAIVGEELTVKVDSIDPDVVHSALVEILGPAGRRDHYARVLCPLGTKPQTLGIYSYIRECVDPPAIVYASPLRHNHEFFSHGVGNSWVLKRAA
jgi:hypothetical protein